MVFLVACGASAVPVSSSSQPEARDVGALSLSELAPVGASRALHLRPKSAVAAVPALFNTVFTRARQEEFDVNFGLTAAEIDELLYVEYRDGEEMTWMILLRAEVPLGPHVQALTMRMNAIEFQREEPAPRRIGYLGASHREFGLLSSRVAVYGPPSPVIARVFAIASHAGTSASLGPASLGPAVSALGCASDSTSEATGGEAAPSEAAPSGTVPADRIDNQQGQRTSGAPSGSSSTHPTYLSWYEFSPLDLPNESPLGLVLAEQTALCVALSGSESLRARALLTGEFPDSAPENLTTLAEALSRAPLGNLLAPGERTLSESISVGFIRDGEARRLSVTVEAEASDVTTAMTRLLGTTVGDMLGEESR